MTLRVWVCSWRVMRQQTEARQTTVDGGDHPVWDGFIANTNKMFNWNYFSHEGENVFPCLPHSKTISPVLNAFWALLWATELVYEAPKWLGSFPSPSWMILKCRLVNWCASKADYSVLRVISVSGCSLWISLWTLGLPSLSVQQRAWPVVTEEGINLLT